jgi:HEAT repeat protein
VRKLLSLLLLALLTLTAPAADVSDLVKKLASKDNDVRRAAAKDLSELGAEAKGATKALAKALGDEDLYVRRFSAQALGAIGPDAKAAIPALTKMLGDDKPQAREAAVKALGKMGPAGVPALMKALSATADVQELAITSLGDAGSAGVPGLVSVIKDGKVPANLRRKAIEVLKDQEDAARSAVPALTQVVKKPDAMGQGGRQLRVEAVNALGRMATGDDKAAVAALEAITKNAKLQDNQLKNAAKRALSSIKERTK